MPQIPVESIANWIEDQIRDRKLRWLITLPHAVVFAIGAIFTILTGVGLIPWNLSTPVNGTALLLWICSFLSVIVLALSRRYMRGEIGQKDAILTRYGDRIQIAQEEKNYFTTVSWTEDVSVKKRGDTEIVRTLRIKADQEFIHAFWNLHRRNSPLHLGQTVKNNVKVEARLLNDDGKPGTRLSVIQKWEGDRSLRMFLFFDRELQPDEEVSIQLIIKWPALAADLLDKNMVEPKTWTFMRATGSFTSTVTYSGDFAPHGVTVSRLSNSPQPIVRSQAGGSTSVQFAIDSSAIKIGQEYGYRIELTRQ